MQTLILSKGVLRELRNPEIPFVEVDFTNVLGFEDLEPVFQVIAGLTAGQVIQAQSHIPGIPDQLEVRVVSNTPWSKGVTLRLECVRVLV